MGASQLLEIPKSLGLLNSLWALQLPGAPPFLNLPKSPRMFSFLWGLQPPRPSQLLRIPQILEDSQLPVSLLLPGALQLQIPGHAQLPEGPNSPSTPQFPGGSPNPCGTPALRESPAPRGDHAAPALPGFCHFCSCCCNKKWERQWLPLPPAPGGIPRVLPCSWGAGAGLGRCFGDKQRSYGQIQDVDVQGMATAGSPPKILMEPAMGWDWEELGGPHTGGAQRVPQEPPKHGTTPSRECGSISLPSLTGGCSEFPGVMWVPNP